MTNILYLLKKCFRKLIGSAPALPFQRILEEKEIKPIIQLVPGFLHEGNLLLLDKAVSRLKRGLYVLEISFFADYLLPLLLFSAGMVAFSIEAYSDDFFNPLQPHEIPEFPLLQNDMALGFAFIDGDHHYAQARKDFQHVDNLLVREILATGPPAWLVVIQIINRKKSATTPFSFDERYFSPC